MKDCSKCGQNLPFENFHKNKSRPDGMSYVCKECAYDYQKAGYALDPSEQSRRRRSYSLKSKFGITLNEFETILESQGGVCASCGTNTPGGNGAFHVDHNHNTGVVRGLLCHGCNLGTSITDSPDGLIRKLMYLVRHGSLPSEESNALLGSFLKNMKQTLIIWACLAAIVMSNSGCPNPHTAERVDNATISAQHDLALNDCVNAAIASVQVGEPYDKVQAEYNACADAADKKYGLKKP